MCEDRTGTDLREATREVEDVWEGDGWYRITSDGREWLTDWYEWDQDLVCDTAIAMARESVRHTTAVWYLGDGDEPEDF